MADLDPMVQAVLEEAQRHGVIGRAPMDKHIEQARAFFEIVRNEFTDGARVLDLGTGGGLPGLVIASAWPQLSVALLDGRSNRAERLVTAVNDLHWADRVTVIAQRAEEAGRRDDLRGAFDLVISRGFGPPAVTVECAAPFLRTGALLVVSDPPGGNRQRWSEAGCAKVGMAVARSRATPWALTVLVQRRPCPDEYPRRTGLPIKRPLFS